MNKTKAKSSAICPCQSGKPYEICCQPYIEQVIDAPTAETLMRSRYTAFVQLDEAYLRYSWHPDNCPIKIHLHKNIKWLGLSIKKTSNGSTDDKMGTVEFVARSKLDGKASRLHEISRFIRFNNRWVYTSGDQQI